MELKIRVAKSDDLENIVALLSSDSLGSNREDSTVPINTAYISAFDSIDRDPNNELLIAEFEGFIVGVLQLTFIPYLTHIGSWRCLIEGVRVHEDFRGRGFGKEMLEHAINLAKFKGCILVQLTSDKERAGAIKFYEKLGFKASHEGFKMYCKNGG